MVRHDTDIEVELVEVDADRWDDVAGYEWCSCRRGVYDPTRYRSCYVCFAERREFYRRCLYCGRWHDPAYETCFKCRAKWSDRDEATSALRVYILWRDGFRCRWCGRSDPLHVDHIVPCSRGGDATPWNLQTLCRMCNIAKGDRWPIVRDRVFRRELLGFYFLTGRGWLDDDQRAALRQEVDEARTTGELGVSA
jgi:5-methylcytosine-specific restriction endonuclease McrA